MDVLVITQSEETIGSEVTKEDIVTHLEAY